MGVAALSHAVFLDRDGVLNRALIRAGKPHPPSSAEEMAIDPDAPDALAQLKREGFLLLVVTNQPDVARGIQTMEAVEAMHARLRAALPMDAFLTCYHDDADGCDCRKPKPGLLLAAARQYGLNLRASFLIGDRWRDIEAGHAAGCTTVWIDRGYAERGPAHPPTARVLSLAGAAAWILRAMNHG
jgi:D-glycero-D-manno-heptose 1,7-bisphosphate phosphatase